MPHRTALLVYKCGVVAMIRVRAATCSHIAAHMQIFVVALAEDGRGRGRRSMALVVLPTSVLLKKNVVGSALPQAEAERPPRAWGPWSDVGRRGAESSSLPRPNSSASSSYLCLALVSSSASSSYLCLALVSVPGSMSPGAPAVVLVSPSLPGSPCPLSAPEWVGEWDPRRSPQQ